VSFALRAKRRRSLSRRKNQHNGAILVYKAVRAKKQASRGDAETSHGYPALSRLLKEWIYRIGT
jgi:hypothetical protein